MQICLVVILTICGNSFHSWDRHKLHRIRAKILGARKSDAPKGGVDGGESSGGGGKAQGGKGGLGLGRGKGSKGAKGRGAKGAEQVKGKKGRGKVCARQPSPDGWVLKKVCLCVDAWSGLEEVFGFEVGLGDCVCVRVCVCVCLCVCLCVCSTELSSL